MSDRYRVNRTLGGGYSVRQTDFVEDAFVGAASVAGNVIGAGIGASISGISTLRRNSRERKLSKAVDDMVDAGEREDFASLLRMATEFSQKNREEPIGPALLSLALAGTGQFGEAHAAVQNAVRLGLDPSEAIDLRINIHYRKGDTAGLLKEGSTLAQNRDRQWEGYMLRARALMQIGDLDLALADANRAISLSPDELGYSLRGDIYRDRRQFAEAVEDYSRAIRLNPKNPDYFERRATVCELLGKADEARADRKAAQGMASNLHTSARTVEAVNFVVYLRKAGVRLKVNSAGGISGGIDVVGGSLKPETRAKLDNLAPELVDLLQPGNKRGAAQVLLAWLRANGVAIQATESDTIRVTQGKLARDDQAELVRLIPELVQLVKEGNL
jgi:tetratricopeptide (TPR) repeat protein